MTCCSKSLVSGNRLLVEIVARVSHDRIRRMKHKVLFVVWAVDSVVLACLLIYIFIHGHDPETIQLSEYLGAIWGGVGAFLLGPAWKAVKQWPWRSKMLLLSGVVVAAVLIFVLFKIRHEQTAKLESLLAEVRNVESRGAPKKQQFMKLVRENPQTLPEYLQHCAELEPVINDYSASEQQVDDVLAQVQQQIGELRPQGRYGAMLPMLAVVRAIAAKDLEGAKIYKQEIDYAKRLPSMPEELRVQFYDINIAPLLEREHQLALDEMAILKDARARGIAMPANMLKDAGLN